MQNVTMELVNASKLELVTAFCRNMESLDKCEDLDAAQGYVDTGKACMYELRARALDRVNLVQLHEAQIMAAELNGTIANLGQRLKEKRAKSGVLLPGDA